MGLPPLNIQQHSFQEDNSTSKLTGQEGGLAPLKLKQLSNEPLIDHFAPEMAYRNVGLLNTSGAI